MREQKEREIQNAILDYLQYQKDVYVWRNSSTGVFDTKRKVYLFNRSKHCIRGVPDILGVLEGGSIFCIEVKTVKGLLTDAQTTFIQNIRRLGGEAFKATSVTEVDIWLKHWRAHKKLQKEKGKDK